MRFFQEIKSNPVSFCKTILMGGEAGEGIKSAGRIGGICLIKSEYNIFVYDEYPSLIRGGHNSVNITYSYYDVYCPNKEIDILICLNRETFDKHKENLNSNSIVIYDHKVFELQDEDTKNCSSEFIDIPYLDILSKNKLPLICKNIILISAAMCIVGVSKEIVVNTIKKELAKKPKLLDANITAADEGYDFVIEYKGLLKTERDKSVVFDKNTKKYLMTGNDAIAFGAIKSELKFYAAYPMTPASTLLTTLTRYSSDFGIVVKQTEDEIAAINMAIGASFAGARSMVGTAGGGFSLMVEGLGLAAITETPLVIVVSQRPGPATGLPTWTAQSDLLFILFASQDEFPRIVLTPTDAEECFYFGFLALNLAEKYQLPVFILVDKYISESLFYFKLNDRKYIVDKGLVVNERILSRLKDFNRYELTENGVSPRSIPGQIGGIFIANSDESDQKGFTNETPQNRIEKMHKRFRKLDDVVKDMPELNVYGDIKSKLTFVCWGSVKGIILESMRRLESIGISSKLIAINCVDPFPKAELIKFLDSSKDVVLVENNFTSQLGKLISMHLGIQLENKLIKYDGRNIFPDEIVNYVINSKS